MPFGFQYLLPVGISFFTFQSLSYTIDFYLGNVHRERNFLRFATFVCFFPQLMAGPIERAKHLLPQFYQFPPVRLQNFTDGASLFLVGLFKKLALANYLSLYVERVYDNPKLFGAPALVLDGAVGHNRRPGRRAAAVGGGRAAGSTVRGAALLVAVCLVAVGGGAAAGGVDARVAAVADHA